MVDRTIPLVINIGMTALAAIRFHEELAGNMAAAYHLGRAWKKWALRAVTLGIHIERRDGRILDDVA